MGQFVNVLHCRKEQWEIEIELCGAAVKEVLLIEINVEFGRGSLHVLWTER